jgi:hypothetical protein
MGEVVIDKITVDGSVSLLATSLRARAGLAGSEKCNIPNGIAWTLIPASFRIFSMSFDSERIRRVDDHFALELNLCELVGHILSEASGSQVAIETNQMELLALNCLNRTCFSVIFRA